MQPCGTIRAIHISLGDRVTERGASSSSLNGINQGWGLLSNRITPPVPSPGPYIGWRDETQDGSYQEWSGPRSPGQIWLAWDRRERIPVGTDPVQAQCWALHQVEGCDKQHVEDCPAPWEVPPPGRKAGPGKAGSEDTSCGA